jgi:N-acetylglutamate synthase
MPGPTCVNQRTRSGQQGSDASGLDTNGAGCFAVGPDRVDRLTQSDVGRRVVVRYRLPGGGQATDVLGHLDAWDDGTLSVRRVDGGTVTVRAADVVAAKVVPPHPVVRRDVRALEAAVAQGWQALETAQIGGWMLRAAGGFTGRANSCLPLASPGIPLADAVAAVERWYDTRGLVPAFQLPAPISGDLDEYLDALGWPATGEDVLVMVAPVDGVADGLRADLPEVVVADVPDAAWLALYRGGNPPPTARELLVNTATVGFGSVDLARRRVAVARGAVTDAPDGRRWLGVTAVHVLADLRRQGLGRQVMAGLASWGQRHGATDVYVQVAEPNTTAEAFHERLGFTEHHRYHYRRHSPRS